MARPSAGCLTLLLVASSLQAQEPVGPVRADGVEPFVFMAAARQRAGTSRLSGRVLSTTGIPLRQAAVSLTDVKFGSVRTIISGPDGRYELPDLPAGRYTISAAKESYVTLSHGQTRPDETPRLLTLVESQAVDGVDIVLPRGGVITGRLVDEYGEPITDMAAVLLERRFAQGQLRPTPTGRVAMTNDVGEYRLFGLPPGQYFVSVAPERALRIPGVADSTVGFAPLYYPGTPVFAQARSVNVNLSATVAGVDMMLALVPLATLSGIVVDAQGKPLGGGSVSAEGRDGTADTPFSASVEPDGSFVMTGLPPGDYVLRASTSRRVVIGAQTFTSTDLKTEDAVAFWRVAINKIERLVPQVDGRMDADPAGVPIAGVSVSGGDVSGVVVAPLPRVILSGRVVFEGGADASVRGSAVRFTYEPRSLEAALSADVYPNATANADLTFQLSAPAAVVSVEPAIDAPGWVLKAIRLNGVDVTDAGLDLRAGHDVSGLEVVLTNRPQEVTGFVTTDRGELLKDYRVLVYPQERERWIFESRLIAVAAPDGDGRFQIRTLPPGRYLAVVFQPQQPVEAHDPDLLERLRPRSTEFALTDGESQTLRLTVGDWR